VGILALSAGGSAAVAQQVSYRQFLQPDGLANLSVPCLLQDRARILWICTENGLFRYDGVRFERLGPETGLDQSRFYAIAEDTAGRLWVGSARELYIGEAGRFEAVRDQGKPLKMGVGAQFAAQPDGSMLFITDRRLYRATQTPGTGVWRIERHFTPAQLAAMPTLDVLSAIYRDPAGALWLGCDKSICRVDPAGIRVWGPAEGVAADEWRAFLTDRRGRLWARSFDHLAILPPDGRAFAPADASRVRLTTAEPFVSLVEDREGRIVTRTDDGLLRWSPEPQPNGSWEIFDGGNGLPDTYLLSLLVDREESLWIGTAGSGLLRWQGYADWESWTTLEGLPSDVVWSVFRDTAGRLMVGTGKGCSLMNQMLRRFESCPFFAAGQPPELNAMVETSDRSLWFTSMDGSLIRAPGGGMPRPFANLPYIRSAWRDHTDTLWLMTFDGLYRVAPAAIAAAPELMPIAEAGQADFSDAAGSADGTPWFASVRGLYSFSGGVLERAAIDDPAASVGFRSLGIGPHDTIWAASVGRGLLRGTIDGRTIGNWSWVTDPLVAGAAISTVRVDEHGRVWLGTDQGLMLFDGKVWRRFDRADGLAWNDNAETAWFFDRDGSIWLGTMAGLTHILHPERLIQSAPLDAGIDFARVGGAPLAAGMMTKLAWQKNLTLTADFAVVDFAEAAGTRFRYRLSGLESDWTETGSASARYSSLEPGAYRLEMVAIQRDHARASPLEFRDFVIRPPWWRSTAFEIVSASIVGLGLVLLIRRREQTLRRRHAVLERDLRERETLLRRATRDPLTGLWNRAAILDRLAAEIGLAAERDRSLALVMADLDSFKAVNDTYGHPAGDAVLCRVSSHLAENVRATDEVGRYGGEELLLVMPGMPERRPCDIVERLQRRIGEIALDDISPGLRVTASFGIAWWRPGEDADGLVARADLALYAAKESGRDRVAYADDPAVPAA
jgi:diguanylate cyclase (GGDEF)-like protein